MAELRITHVIAGLETGGAEMMLLKLITETHDRMAHHVVSLTGMGTLGARIETAGAQVTAMNLRGPLQSLTALPCLARILKQSNPSVVQGWMYHGNIAASLAALLAGARWPVAWAIRCTIETFEERLLTRLLVHAGALLSRQPRVILYNSSPALAQHEAIGYARRGTILGNGFEMEKFTPDPEARAALRASIGVAPDQPLAGYVGRLAPIKDLPTFFAAMAQAATARPDLAVVAIGRDLPRAIEALPQSRDDLAKLEGRLTLLPEQADVRGWYQAFDISLLSSSAEGFPNVIGEAMASGTPCVSTDVGGCAEIIADTGYVVPVRAHSAMAQAVLEIAAMTPQDRAALGARARARIAKHYSIGSIARAHEAEWSRLATAGQGNAA
jgi:glycosyltransferase involved in cell wall biosynthesis